MSRSSSALSLIVNEVPLEQHHLPGVIMRRNKSGSILKYCFSQQLSAELWEMPPNPNKWSHIIHRHRLKQFSLISISPAAFSYRRNSTNRFETEPFRRCFSLNFLGVCEPFSGCLISNSISEINLSVFNSIMFQSLVQMDLIYFVWWL